MRGFLLFVIFCCTGIAQAQQQVDLIVYNAHIFTANAKQLSASVLVVDSGKIVALADESLLKKYSASKTVDAEGQYLYPGFIDAHHHFTGYANDMYKLNLYATSSFD
ncbi:MAG: amidohydrolase, partial [Chitinophagaceae bacterium]